MKLRYKFLNKGFKSSNGIVKPKWWQFRKRYEFWKATKKMEYLNALIDDMSAISEAMGKIPKGHKTATEVAMEIRDERKIKLAIERSNKSFNQPLTKVEYKERII